MPWWILIKSDVFEISLLFRSCISVGCKSLLCNACLIQSFSFQRIKCLAYLTIAPIIKCQTQWTNPKHTSSRARSHTPIAVTSWCNQQREWTFLLHIRVGVQCSSLFVPSVATAISNAARCSHQPQGYRVRARLPENRIETKRSHSFTHTMQNCVLLCIAFALIHFLSFTLLSFVVSTVHFLPVFLLFPSPDSCLLPCVEYVLVQFPNGNEFMQYRLSIRMQCVIKC